MDYTLPSEIQLLREVLRDFVEHEVRPRVAAMEAGERIPRELIDRMADIGVFGAPFPPEYGGAGLGELGFAVVQEELSRAHTSTGLLAAASTGLAARAVHLFGDERQRQRYLVPLAAGRMLGAFCLTEADAGSDITALTTRAVIDGDSYVLDGGKVLITNGDQADVLLVFAKTDPDAGQHGISLFAVDGKTPGCTVVRVEDKMGLRASSTAALAFDGLRVPRENLIGQAGNGFAMALACLDYSRIGIAAMCLGVAREAVDLAWQFVHERKVGAVPLASYQITQHAFADMEVTLYAAESIVYRTAAMADAGESIEGEASICKVFVSEAAQRVVDAALQLHGGAGYIRDAGIERLYRDIRAARIYEGTNEVQRNNIYRVTRHRRG